MFAIDAQSLAIGFGFLVVVLVAVVVFTCIQATGQAERYFEKVTREASPPN